MTDKDTEVCCGPKTTPVSHGAGVRTQNLPGFPLQRSTPSNVVCATLGLGLGPILDFPGGSRPEAQEEQLHPAPGVGAGQQLENSLKRHCQQHLGLGISGGLWSLSTETGCGCLKQERNLFKASGETTALGNQRNQLGGLMASAPHPRALTWQPVPLTPRLGQSLQNLSPPGLQTPDAGTARTGLYVPAFLGHGFLQRLALGACDWWSLGHVPRLS